MAIKKHRFLFTQLGDQVVSIPLSFPDSVTMTDLDKVYFELKELIEDIAEKLENFPALLEQRLAAVEEHLRQLPPAIVIANGIGDCEVDTAPIGSHIYIVK